MIFKYFYLRDDPEEEWRFDEDFCSKNTKVIGQCTGCENCCSNSVELTKELLEESIKELQDRLNKNLEILRKCF